MNRIFNILCLCLLFMSCGKKEIRTTLNGPEKSLFDSLNVLRAEETRKMSDSICKAQRAVMYDRAVDSMLSIRLMEIQNLVKDEK